MFLVEVFVEDLIKVFVEFHQKVKVLNEDLNEVFNEDLFYGTALREGNPSSPVSARTNFSFSKKRSYFGPNFATNRDVLGSRGNMRINVVT